MVLLRSVKAEHRGQCIEGGRVACGIQRELVERQVISRTTRERSERNQISIAPQPSSRPREKVERSKTPNRNKTSQTKKDSRSTTSV